MSESDEVTNHLSAEETALFLDGETTAAEEERVQAHLDECSACRALVVEARDVLHADVQRRRLRVGIPAVAAAAAVAGLLVIGGPLTREAADGPDLLRRSTVDAEREGVDGISVLSPASDDAVETDGLSFEWRPLGDGALYRLTITDEGGDPLWTGETYDASILLPSEIVLSSGQEYLWYVDALLLDGQTATTGVQSFRTAR